VNIVSNIISVFDKNSFYEKRKENECELYSNYVFKVIIAIMQNNIATEVR